MTARHAQLALLLAPCGVGAAVLVALPAVVTLVTSLYDTDLLGPAQPVGLENFRELLADPVFHRSLRNSLVFAALTVPVRLVAALGLALLLHRPRRFAGAQRTAACLPTVVPEVATVIAWTFLLNPVFGPVNGSSARSACPSRRGSRRRSPPCSPRDHVVVHDRRGLRDRARRPPGAAGGGATTSRRSRAARGCTPCVG